MGLVDSQLLSQSVQESGIYDLIDESSSATVNAIDGIESLTSKSHLVPTGCLR